MKVIVQSLPDVDFGEDTLLCVPAAGIPVDTQFVVLDAFTEGYSYLWQDSSTNSTFRVSEPDTYFVFMQNGICAAFDTAIVQQQVIPIIDLGPDSILCEGQTMVLDATFTLSEVEYLWNTGEEDSVLLARLPGLYDVQISNGCGTFFDNILLEFEDCWNVWIPSAFTPNSDGDNDYFRAESDQPFDLFELTVFNRLGEIVFFSTDIQRAWDGTNNGVMCPNDVYNYSLKYISAYDVNQGEFEQVGTVTILR
jgi:gliding motility-associated-like protein